MSIPQHNGNSLTLSAMAKLKLEDIAIDRSKEFIRQWRKEKEKKKKSAMMSDFEKQLKAIFDAYNGVVIDTVAAVKVNAPVLLELAKKELAKISQ